ncbi:MAG: PAS domain-containing protein [Desulfobaccales bacterium]|jgi:PAS domain S-box-containing protein
MANHLAILLFVAAGSVQLAAAYCALRLVRVTGRSPAWLLISAAFCLMAMRRIVLLGYYLAGNKAIPFSFWEDGLTLAISVVLLAGLLYISPLMVAIKRGVALKRSQEDSEAERQRLYAMLDGMPAMVNVAGPDYSIRFGNRFFRERYGDWEGKRCFELLACREEPCSGCPALRVFETGAEVEMEWTDAPRQRTYQMYYYPLKDPDGTILALTLGIDITGRKLAEENLRKQEREYRWLVRAIPALVFKGYPDWSIDFFDDEIETLTGYPQEEFTSRRLKWSDLILEEDLGGEYKQAFIKALKEDGRFIREYRIRTKDGRILWLEGRGQIIFRPDGQIDHVIGVIYDVSERRATREALLLSESRLAKAQQLAHLAYWEWNPKSGEMVWSEELYRIYGVDKRSFAPSLEAGLSLTHPEDAARVRDDLARALAGERAVSQVSRIVRPDGAIRYLHTQEEVILDERGRPWRLVGAAQDITERRIAELRLRESEARFRAVFERAALGIGLIDLKGRYLSVNNAFLEMLGYGEAELRGKPISELTHADDRKRSLELFREVATGRRESYRIEKRFQRKNGQYLWCRVTASLVQDPEGQPLYVAGMAEDITQRKEAETRLRESEEKLRHLASKLMSAQEDERKRISRELHDELGQALLVLKLQAREIKKELPLEAQHLHEECEGMLTNLDQVVDKVRRLSHDLSPMIVEDLGLSAALQHLLGEFCKHNHLECEFQEIDIDDLFPVEAQVAIYRIFQECLTNIGKHSQASRMAVSMDRKPDRVSFIIKDNGKGYSAEARRRGRGMGLVAMEERARMVGGDLSVQSREGQGASISFEIPFSSENHQKSSQKN